MRARPPLRLAPLVLLLALAGCGRYLAIPWADPPGGSDSVGALGERLAAALSREVSAPRPFRLRARGMRRSGKNSRLRVAVAAFAEARTGVRTELSRRIEAALRAALERTGAFEVVDGGSGVSWQEAAIAFPPGTEAGTQRGASGVVGDPEEYRRAGEGDPALRGRLARELDGDHPKEGLWPRARDGRYGEDSAVYAASLLDADAAVYGAYALGPERVRVWAAVVNNGPKRTRYYRRGLEDVFGEPERLKRSRIYLGHARDHLPRGALPEAWLATPLAPRPRAQPRHPTFWASRGFEVVLEGMDARGRKTPLRGGEVLGPDAYVVGRLSVASPRYLYAFAIDKEGRAEVVFGALEERARAARLEPGRLAFFTARLLPPGRSYRLYFVSAEEPFDGRGVVRAARRRLGLPPREDEGGVRGGFGAPEAPWFVPPGQERLILESGWSQRVFWFFKRRG